MLFVGHDEVLELMSIHECVDVMKDALIKLSNGEVNQYLRTATHLPNGNILGFMPCYSGKNGYFGTKVITVYKTNRGSGYPSHQGVILLFDAKYGYIKSLIEASAITKIRTAAVSAVATELLSRKDVSTLSILGAGEQARAHLEAMLLVRNFKEVIVWNINRNNSHLFVQEMKKQYGVDIIVTETVEEAVSNADVICTVTASKTPVLEGRWVKPGTHINAVGACSPDARELDSEIVLKSKLYVDSVESTKNEAGDFLIPKQEGLIDNNHILGEIGDILTDKIVGRSNNTDITIFEALGLAIEDIAAASYVYDKVNNNNQ
jgi:ornithine cyclodeaminase